MNSKSYIIVVIGILFAKVIGFSRDIFFANFYGTGIYADIYFQIFGFVILVFAGIAVTLQTKIVMGLNQAELDTEEKKRIYVSGFLKKTIGIVTLVTFGLYLCVKPFTRILLPGLTGEEFHLAVKLSCIMFPSLLFICVAYSISGVLQSNNVFFITSIVSLPYNLVIILSLFLPGVTIEQIGIATTIGWFLHIVIQLPDFYRKGYRIFYRNQTSETKKREPFDMSLCWIFLSNLMFQICFIIDKSCVSDKVGEAAVLNYGSNLFVTIAGIFVTAMSSVIFPKISKNYQEGKKEDVCRLVGDMFTTMAAIFVPYLLVVGLFGEQFVGLLYERGEFTRESTIATAAVFCIYSFGILGYIAEELVNKVLYLAKEYRYTLGGTIIVVLVKLIFDILFVPEYGTKVAAWSTTILISGYAVISLLVLKKHIGNYVNKRLVYNLIKIGCAATASAVVYFILLNVLPEMTKATDIRFVIPIAICGVVYIGTAGLLGLHKEIMNR